MGNRRQTKDLVDDIRRQTVRLKSANRRIVNRNPSRTNSKKVKSAQERRQPFPDSRVCDQQGSPHPLLEQGPSSSLPKSGPKTSSAPPSNGAHFTRGSAPHGGSAGEPRPGKISKRYTGKYSNPNRWTRPTEAIDFFPESHRGKWLRFTAAIIRNEAGDLIGAIETLEDITRRKKAKEALLKAHRDGRTRAGENDGAGPGSTSAAE